MVQRGPLLGVVERERERGGPPMAWLEKRGDKFRIKFRYGGRSHQVSLKTDDESEARGNLARLEENLRLLERGRIELPAGADVGLFLVTDGRVTGKPAVTHKPTVADVFALYTKNLTAGAKEANTRKCESIPMRDLEPADVREKRVDFIPPGGIYDTYTP
jgi:hypothetical protein